MAQFVLRTLKTSDESAFRLALNSWVTDSHFVFAPHYDPDMDFADYVNALEDQEVGRNLRKGFVPDTNLFAFIDGQIIGRVSIRHYLNDFLLNTGGHIGYGVTAPHRKKGYATEMLKGALVIAKNLGIERALITCDETNIGSVKVIEKNGGVLENKIQVDADLPLRNRYWIDLA